MCMVRGEIQGSMPLKGSRADQPTTEGVSSLGRVSGINTCSLGLGVSPRRQQLQRSNTTMAAAKKVCVIGSGNWWVKDASGLPGWTWGSWTCVKVCLFATVVSWGSPYLCVCFFLFFLSSSFDFYTMQRNFVKSGQTLRGKWAAAAVDKRRGIMHIVDKVFLVFYAQWRSCEAWETLCSTVWRLFNRCSSCLLWYRYCCAESALPAVADPQPAWHLESSVVALLTGLLNLQSN